MGRPAWLHQLAASAVFAVALFIFLLLFSLTTLFSHDYDARSLVSSSDLAKSLLDFFLRSGKVGPGSPTFAKALRSTSAHPPASSINLYRFCFRQ
jgi:hypothetical protein